MFFYLKALLLGAIQGITEFLPISSTGHLVIVQKWFNLDQQVFGLNFDIFTNIGTFLAILIIFRQRIITWFSKKNYKELILIGVATIPAGIAGLLAQDYIETTLRSTYVIIVSLIAVALLMLLVEKKGAFWKLNNQKSVISMGLGQVLALIPGISRSGITITTGISTGLTRAKAAEYSFLLSLPITFFAIAKKSMDLPTIFRENSNDVVIFYIVGLVSSFVFGIFAIKWLLKYLNSHPLSVFAYYRLFLAGVLILLAL